MFNPFFSNRGPFDISEILKLLKTNLKIDKKNKLGNAKLSIWFNFFKNLEKEDSKFVLIGNNKYPKKFYKLKFGRNVLIGKNCYVGANTSIDRAVLESTIISDNSHLDNLIQIAHNVKIGKHAVIAAQVGIAGSTSIGNYVKIGGQAGISGHLSIGDNVTIAAKSGVTKNIENNQIVAGFPAIDIKKWKKNIIKLNKANDN